MENKIIVYFVFENGAFVPEVLSIYFEMFEKEGYMIEDFGMGSAYNMPEYLLGEIEDHLDKAVVTSFCMDEGDGYSMIFFNKDEVDAVIEGLKAAKPGEDSYDILKEVHKKIRK
ncbi:MAG: hypothetical protein K5894_01310 [Lachnospiraceae bacterium]|nr:hypothetical protein [Lachnospiraceae bacterium]